MEDRANRSETSASRPAIFHHSTEKVTYFRLHLFSCTSMMIRLDVFLLVILASVTSVSAFFAAPASHRTSAPASSLHLFGAFGGGGLKPGEGTTLSYNGKQQTFKPGSPLKDAVAKMGVKVTYSCKKGDCATCQISLGGRMTKPCVAKVPPPPKLKSLQEKGLEIKK